MSLNALRTRTVLLHQKLAKGSYGREILTEVNTVPLKRLVKPALVWTYVLDSLTGRYERWQVLAQQTSTAGSEVRSYREASKKSPSSPRYVDHRVKSGFAGMGGRTAGRTHRPTMLPYSLILLSACATVHSFPQRPGGLTRDQFRQTARSLDTFPPPSDLVVIVSPSYRQ